MTQLVTIAADRVPALVTAAGDLAAYRFLEFFTAQIRNPNTRRAYVRAVGAFLTWLEAQGVPSIAEASSLHVAAYVEQLTRSNQSAPTVKQQLAAIRRLFDWLAAGGVLPFNPASAVRGPSHSAKTGATPVLDPQEARQLLDAIDICQWALNFPHFWAWDFPRCGRGDQPGRGSALLSFAGRPRRLAGGTAEGWASALALM